MDYSNDNVRSLFVFVGIFTSILITAVTYASGGMIDVLLSIESRLYRSEQIHFQTLQAQNKLSDIEQVLRRQEQQNAKILQALNNLNELERQKIEADKDVQAQ